jgi:transketolase
MIPSVKELRKTVLQMSNAGKDGNLQSAFSSMEILRVLYELILRISPDYPDDPSRDYFVLSKGQATISLLAILAGKGFFHQDELLTFCQFSSRISMQADRTKIPGIEVSAGSLGHGLPIAVGIAWACRIQGIENQIFVLVGDGEMNEGPMWEALLFAGSEGLNNLTVIVDDNESIQKMINMQPLDQKINAFQFKTTVINGHNEHEIYRALSERTNKPHAVIAKTKRGYGSETLMHDPSWFHRYPTDDELKKLLKETEAFK